MVSFSEILRQLRKKENLSQKELAKEIGVSQSIFTHWENGSAQPTAENILALATYFEITTDKLLGFNSKEPKEEFTYDEREVIQAYRKLSPRRKENIVDNINALADQEERENKQSSKKWR